MAKASQAFLKILRDFKNQTLRSNYLVSSLSAIENKYHTVLSAKNYQKTAQQGKAMFQTSNTKLTTIGSNKAPWQRTLMQVSCKPNKNACESKLHKTFLAAKYQKRPRQGNTAAPQPTNTKPSTVDGNETEWQRTLMRVSCKAKNKEQYPFELRIRPSNTYPHYNEILIDYKPSIAKLYNMWPY